MANLPPSSWFKKLIENIKNNILVVVTITIGGIVIWLASVLSAAKYLGSIVNPAGASSASAPTYAVYNGGDTHIHEGATYILEGDTYVLIRETYIRRGDGYIRSDGTNISAGVTYIRKGDAYFPLGQTYSLVGGSYIPNPAKPRTIIYASGSSVRSRGVSVEFEVSSAVSSAGSTSTSSSTSTSRSSRKTLDISSISVTSCSQDVLGTVGLNTLESDIKEANCLTEVLSVDRLAKVDASVRYALELQYDEVNKRLNSRNVFRANPPADSTFNK